MARRVIREIAVTPRLPPDLVVFEREAIQHFIDAAHRTVARLQAELEVERNRQPDAPDAAVIDNSDDWAVPYKRRLFSLPEWSERGDDDHDNVAFFESLRDGDAGTLIAGFEERAQALVDADADHPRQRWVYRQVEPDHPSVRGRRAAPDF